MLIILIYYSEIKVKNRSRSKVRAFRIQCGFAASFLSTEFNYDRRTNYLILRFT